MKIVLLAIAVFLFSGCSVTYPSVTDYRIDPQVELPVKQNRCKKHSIKVSPIFSNVSLSSTAMRYSVGRYKEYSFTQSAWSDSPSRMIANKLVNVLDDSALFDGVYGYKSSKSGDLVLEMSINEFIQSFNEAGDRSDAKIDISFNLIEKKSGKLIASKNFFKVMKTKTADAEGGVEALNILLGEVLEDTVVWLSGSER
ncbi:ABC-type transport auxiliary lipoprotein family protein [Sulfurimonas microaerophilic]|uniref:ABC-type transport auxiliary lipoprotein family protein n=1 Tax=Sulfurimonas microaerophilic TaxID=3058392 RepID=UPI00271559A6|nr:ABC-type transport auxiliary lipoprotein family protein [Sulfurimonas sp. hsl 1-7]